MRWLFAVTSFTAIVVTVSLIGSAQGAKPGAPTIREQELGTRVGARSVADVEPEGHALRLDAREGQRQVDRAARWR